MIILRKTFSVDSSIPRRLRRSKTSLGRFFTDGIVETRRAKEYRKEMGLPWYKPVFRFGRRFRDWELNRFGDTAVGGIYF